MKIVGGVIAISILPNQRKNSTAIDSIMQGEPGEVCAVMNTAGDPARGTSHGQPQPYARRFRRS